MHRNKLAYNSIDSQKSYALLRNITSIFIYLVFTIFILFCGSNGYADMFDAKFRTFCFLFGGYIIIILLLMLELAIIGELKIEWSRAWNSIGLPQKVTILYLLCTWISAIISPYFPDTLMGISRHEGAITITIYCLVFILVSLFGKITRQMIYAFSITVSIFAIICILQIQGFNPLALYPEGYNYHDAFIAYNGQFLGTIGNADMVAGFLCIAIPILSLSLISIKDKKRFFIVLPLLLSLYVLIKMWVLAGVVGIVLGGVLSIPFCVKKPRKIKLIILAIIFFISIIGIVAIYHSNIRSGLLFELKEILHGNFDNSFGSGRLYIWKSIIREIPENIFFGTGPDTMAKAGFEPFVRYSPQLNTTIVAEIDIAHNEYLNILFHQGIFAFVTYMLIIGSILYKWFNSNNKSTCMRLLGGALICYLIQAFFGFSSCVVSPIFWVIAGLMAKEIKEVDHE